MKWCPNIGRMSDEQAEAEKRPMCRGSAGKCWGRSTLDADGYCNRHGEPNYHRSGSRPKKCADCAAFNDKDEKA